MDAASFASSLESVLDELGMPADQSHRATEPIPASWPAALRALHAVAGEHPLCHEHNRLLRPSETRREGHRMIFAEENQDVVVWAVDAADGSADPLVWQGQPQPDGSMLWYSEDAPLTEFITGMWRSLSGVSPD